MTTTVPTAYVNRDAIDLAQGAPVDSSVLVGVVERQTYIWSKPAGRFVCSPNFQTTSASYVDVVVDVPFQESEGARKLTFLSYAIDGDVRLTVSDGVFSTTATNTHAAGSPSLQTSSVDLALLTGPDYALTVEARKTTTSVIVYDIAIEEKQLTSAEI